MMVTAEANQALKNAWLARKIRVAKRAATATRVEHMELARWYVDKTTPLADDEINGTEIRKIEKDI